MEKIRQRIVILCRKILCTFALIYYVYILYGIITNDISQIPEIVLWTIIGLGLVGVNLIFAHKLAEILDKKIKI